MFFLFQLYEYFSNGCVVCKITENSKHGLFIFNKLFSNWKHSPCRNIWRETETSMCRKKTDVHVCIRNERKYLFLWKYFRFNSIRSILQYCEHTWLHLYKMRCQYMYIDEKKHIRLNIYVDECMLEMHLYVGGPIIYKYHAYSKN